MLHEGVCKHCHGQGKLTAAFGWIHYLNGGRRCPVPGVGVLAGECLATSFEPAATKGDLAGQIPLELTTQERVRVDKMLAKAQADFDLAMAILHGLEPPQ